MRRRTIVFAQTRLGALDWLRLQHPDINPNGKDIRIIPTAGGHIFDGLRGRSGFDYVTLDNWDVFLTAKERKAFWDRITDPNIDARQLSPDSLAPLQ